MASAHPSPREVSDDVGRFLAGNSASTNNLHALGRLISSAMDLEEVDAPITAGSLLRAMERDLRWLLPRLVYRGRALSLENFRRWAAQFPPDLAPLATHLTRQIAERYYFGADLYFSAIDTLIKNSGIREGSRVVFCRWQHMGASAPTVAHDLKNQGRWNVLGEINLDEPVGSWPTFVRPEPDYFVLADDFVGSGETLAKLFRREPKWAPGLLQDYKSSELRVLVVAGFEDGIRSARSAMSEAAARRSRIITAKLFREQDTCFDATSSILTNDTQREAFRRFCLDAAREYFPTMNPRMRLGFGKLGSLVIFFNTVPNNTLPILWHTTGRWFPLFPASGLLTG